MYRECRSLQLPVLVDMLLLSVFLCSQVGGNGAEWKCYIGYYCCKLLVVQSTSTLQCLSVSSFRPTYHVAAFSSCKVSVYLVRKHQPPQHTVHSISNSQLLNSGTFTQEIQFSWYLQVAERYTCTSCGSLLLFKTERVLSAIQQTCFCQLWVISTNY